MKYKVIYSPESLDDLRWIYAYIAFRLRAPGTAKGQTDRIRKEIRSLCEMPERYGPVDWEPWTSIGMRHVPVDNYTVYYLVDKTARLVQIVRIFYAGQDAEQIAQDMME